MLLRRKPSLCKGRENIEIVQFEQQERVLVDLVGDQIDHRRDMLAAKCPVRTRATRRNIIPGLGEQRHHVFLKDIEQRRRQSAGEKLGEKQRVSGDRVHDRRFISRGEFRQRYLHLIGPWPRAFHIRRNLDPQDIDLCHRAIARIALAARQPVGIIGAGQRIQPFFAPPGIAEFDIGHQPRPASFLSSMNGIPRLSRKPAAIFLSASFRNANQSCSTSSSIIRSLKRRNAPLPFIA